MATTHTVDTLAADPCASYRLKSWVRDALNADPVDALADAEALVDALKARLDSMQTATPTPAGRVQ